MSPTLDYRLKGAFSLLANNPDNPCLINVLIFLILHKNSRGRCWISTETIAENATRGDPNKAVHAKKWLIEHDAIKLVPYEKRTGDETKLPKRQHIFQLTGYIRNEDIIYPYLYLSDTDMDEFRRAAQDVAGDIINQVHAKPKVKRVNNKRFISHKSADKLTTDLTSEKSVTSSKPNSEISDVHIMNVPNQSISNISSIYTTYENFHQNENSPVKSTDFIGNNPSQIQNQPTVAVLPVMAPPLSSAPMATSSFEYITVPKVGTPTESEKSPSVLQNNNIVSATVFIDTKGEAIVDPSLVISTGSHTTYICPCCRSYITDQPNKLCSKCFNKGASLDVKTIEALESLEVDGKYSKEIRKKVQAVTFAIVRSWPGKSQAYGWAGKFAQMLVGVAPKKSGDYYTHRLRQEATPEEVVAFAEWWVKVKAAGRSLEMPSSPESVEKFFSEFREYSSNQEKKREAGARKYIDIDMSNYR